MDNIVFDLVYDLLVSALGTDEGLYRNKAPAELLPPYKVLSVVTGQDTYPTVDFEIRIRYYEEQNESVRGLADLANEVETLLNHRTITSDDLIIHITLGSHRYFNSEEYLDLAYYESTFIARVY